METQGPTAPLPHDLKGAYQLIAALYGDLDQSSQREHVLHAQIGEERRRVAALEQQLHWLRKQVFGRRSEKGVPVEQQALPFATAAGQIEADARDEDGGEEHAALTAVPAHTRRTRGGRTPLPDDLPREIVELLPADADRCCEGCQAEKVRIGEDRTEELDYVPASMVVRVYVRPKYACRQCESGVVQAVLPARPIEKGRPGPGLLAHVITSKYGDHLPLYRLERIFPRHGIDLSRQTLSEWCGAVADLLKPVATQIAADVLSSKWVQSDDTGVDVQNRTATPQIRTGHVWAYRGSEASAFYDFTWMRNSEGPRRVLAH
ncbi:MAG: IS66 family transposase, partial [Solirubrobacteraceae bacterium]